MDKLFSFMSTILLFWNFDQKMSSYLIFIFYLYILKSIIFSYLLENIAIVVVLVSRQTLPLEKWSSSKKSMLRFVVCWFQLKNFISDLLDWQELFSELDTEEDGNIYLKEVIVTLKALNHDLDHNLRVRLKISDW